MLPDIPNRVTFVSYNHNANHKGTPPRGCLCGFGILRMFLYFLSFFCPSFVLNYFITS